MTKNKSKLKIIKIVTLISLIVSIGGCSVLNSKERRIEKQLKEKYGVSFKVTHIQKINDNHYMYYANEKGDAKRKFTGFFGADVTDVTDGYIDALIAYKIGEEMSQELQGIIPGVRVLAMPSGQRSFPYPANDVEITIEQWIQENYNETLNNGGELQGVLAVLLVPEESVEGIVYDEYKSYMTSLMEGKYEKISSLSIEGVYVYDSDIILENLNQRYKIGYYDVLDLRSATMVPEYGVEVKVSQYASVLLGFRYLNGEFGNDYVVEFRYDKVEKIEHE